MKPDTDLTIPPHKNDNILGSLSAEILLTEYGDYQCPHCKKATEYLPKLLKKYSNSLALVFRHFPMQTQNEFAMLAAEAAEAAGAQGKFWQMHELIYKNQSKLDRAVFYDFAKELKLNMDLFETDMKNHVHSNKINSDFMSGIKSGVNGTPTFYFNGKKYTGLKNYEDLDFAINSLLEK